MAELKATVGVLRDGDSQAASLAPTPGLGQLEGLFEATRQAGLRVETTVAGDPRPLPPAVDLTAYRIVQESLTNVVRHAQATTATVAIRYQPDGLGHGLVGMAERAVTLGGRLEAGPRPSGGFRVWSSLPAGRGV